MPLFGEFQPRFASLSNINKVMHWSKTTGAVTTVVSAKFVGHTHQWHHRFDEVVDFFRDSSFPRITHLASLTTIDFLIHLFHLEINIGGSEVFLQEVPKRRAFHVLPPHDINGFSHVFTVILFFDVL